MKKLIQKTYTAPKNLVFLNLVSRVPSWESLAEMRSLRYQGACSGPVSSKGNGNISASGNEELGWKQTLRIKHCGAYRKAETIWLYPFEPKFKYILLHILKSCPKCKQEVLEWQGINHNNEHTFLRRVKYKEHFTWYERIKTHQVTGERNHPGWSDATHELKKDTAVVWMKNLSRYGFKAQPKVNILKGQVL